MSVQGISDVGIAKTLSLNVITVATWWKRFNEYRLVGLYDMPLSGKPPEYNKEQIKEAIGEQLEKPFLDDVQSFWDGPLLTEVLEMPDYIIREILKIEVSKLQSQKFWSVSAAPNYCLIN
jgi:transposase